MIKAWWLLLLIPAEGLGFMMAAMLSAGKSADSYKEGLKQGEKTGYFKGYKEGRECGLKTADILLEGRALLPLMVGGAALAGEAATDHMARLNNPMYGRDFDWRFWKPVLPFVPVSREAQDKLQEIRNDSLPEKPESGLYTEEDG